MPVLIISMKFMSTPLNAKQNQEVTQPRSRFLSGKLTWDRKAFNTLVPLSLSLSLSFSLSLSLSLSLSISFWNNLPGSMKKNFVLNTLKCNLKEKYLGNLAGSQDLQDYYWHLPIFLAHLFIYLFIYLFIFVLIHFSLSLIQPFVFNFCFTYLPFPFHALTIYLILFITHPFRYPIVFLTCHYLCYNIIIYLAFICLLHIN